jgi:hypothetical protein
MHADVKLIYFKIPVTKNTSKSNPQEQHPNIKNQAKQI